MKVCRAEATESGCRLTLTPPPSQELLVLLFWLCRSRHWSFKNAAGFPGAPLSEIDVDGPAPDDLAGALRGEPGFDYTVTVG